MTTRVYSAHRRSIVRPIALVLAVAGAGYVAGAFLAPSVTPRNAATEGVEGQSAVLRHDFAVARRSGRE